MMTDDGLTMTVMIHSNAHRLPQLQVPGVPGTGSGHSTTSTCTMYVYSYRTVPGKAGTGFKVCLYPSFTKLLLPLFIPSLPTKY